MSNKVSKAKKELLIELLDAIYVDKRKYNQVESLREARKIAASL
jgi:hypothetical protein